MNKKLLVLLLLWLPVAPAFAGNEDSLAAFNLLQAPNSPAANMLGVANSDIARFTDPSAFMVSVYHAARDINSFPSSYAVDVAPAWLFTGRNITYESMRDDNNLKTRLWQSLQISAGYDSETDTAGETTLIGLGIKLSLKRGRFNRQVTQLVDSTTQVLKMVNYSQDSIKMIVQAMPERVRLKALYIKYLGVNADSAEIYRQKLNSFDSAGIASYAAAWSAKAAQLKAMVSRMNFDRVGFKMDLAAGLTVDYADQVFSNAATNKAGAWLTGGYTTEGGFTAMALVRYLYNPDKIYADDKGKLTQANLNTLDGGVRMLYSSTGSNFSFSGEGIYRSVLEDPSITTWRFTVNADYEVAPNKILTLAFGRNFDGTFNKDGNVIAAINFVMGFGSSLKKAL